MLSAHALSSCSPVYSPSDCEPFLTHRWESANQPHSVLALIQTLNWEEEQFHTPYLAWERKSETAWVLPGKTGCCGWAGWWKTYPEPGGKSMGPCQLTPKENDPRALPLKDPSPALHREYVWHGLGEQSLRRKATQNAQQMWQYTSVTARSS